MELQIEQQGTVAIIHCAGSLDAGNVAQFKRATLDLCEQGITRFVLNGHKLQFIDSMGLGALISLLRRVRQQEGEVKVAQLTPDVRSIFEITRLHRLFDICDTPLLACQKFKNG